MSAEVIKFPYNACRRVHSRKPRNSKNGTPEERAAKAAAMLPAPADVVLLSDRSVPAEPVIDRRKLRGNPMRDYIPAISFGATVCGKLYTMDLKGERLGDVPPDLRMAWFRDLHHAIEALPKLSAGLAQAAETLGASISGQEFAAFVATLPLEAQIAISAKIRDQ